MGVTINIMKNYLADKHVVIGNVWDIRLYTQLTNKLGVNIWQDK